MPALKFKAIEPAKVIEISKELIDELEELIKCPRSSFSIEVDESTYIIDGVFCEGCPKVEVAWFDRGQEVQDKAALIITNKVRAAGCTDVDVIFTVLEKNRYYENGKHF
ncbi:MAG: DUF1904 domain-containing protein [Clostridiaceae bacterium]